MSQDDLSTPSAPSRSTEPLPHRPLSVTFSKTPIPNPASWKHVVVSLSPRKQQQIMAGIGRLHSVDSPFPTWSVVGEALSTALLFESAGLHVVFSMKLHQKDVLLFTRNNSPGMSTGAGASSAALEKTGRILDVDFVKRLEGAVWEAHWQEARPTLAHFVRGCACIHFNIKMLSLGES